MTADLAAAAAILLTLGLTLAGLRWLRPLTAVSTIAGTNYEPPASLLWGVVGVAFVALAMLGVARFGGGWATVAVVLVHGLVQLGLWAIALAAAHAGAPLRLALACESPSVAGARFALHFSGLYIEKPWHIEMWRGPLATTGETTVLLLRERKHFRLLRAQGEGPALLVNDRAGLGMFAAHADALAAVFYVNNSYKNVESLEVLAGRQHVQLLHGDSDKPPSFHPTARNYDLLFVAGQMAIDRYARARVEIPPERFRIVGRPQVADIAVARADAARVPRAVGYMPTWEGHYSQTRFSSLERASRIIAITRETLPKAAITVKLHPMTKEKGVLRLDEIRARLAGHGEVVNRKSPPEIVYNAVDILVTDISSVMIDFLYSDKPFLVILPPDFSAWHLKRFPSLEAAYQVDADLNNLAEMLTLAATEDPLRARRQTLRDAAFGDTGRPPGDAFREACAALVSAEIAAEKTLEEKAHG